MKKKLIALLPLLSLGLAACDLPFGLGGGVDGEFDLVPKMSGGTKAQRTAICSAINDLSPCVNRNTTDLFPDTTISMKQDDGDYIRVTTKQVVGDFTVELKWAADESQATFGSMKQSDDEHQIINVKYPGYGNPDTEFTWTLESATCGSAKTKGTVASYKATLIAETHPHERMTIAQINKCTMEAVKIHNHDYPSTFDMVDYDKDSPYFAPNKELTEGYHYVTVPGKVIYYAPDGNWLLLGDGKQVVEIYAGSGTGLTPQNFPALKNEYVEISGNLSQYTGNIQIGFVTIINEIEKGNIVDPDLTGTNIDASFITTNFELPSPYVCQRQAIDGFSNSIGKITGTVKPATLKDKSGNSKTTSQISARDRFTFEVELTGGKKMVVAYDYHTDSDKSTGIYNALIAKLGGENSITIKGTMRYNGNDENAFILDNGNKGVWNLVPFSAADIA